MLKRIVFENLVHFKDKSVIELQNYPEKKNENRDSEADASNASNSDNTDNAEAIEKESTKSNASSLDKIDDAEAIEKESTKCNASNLEKTDDAEAKEKESTKSNASNLDKTDDAGGIEKESTKSNVSNLDKTDDAGGIEKESTKSNVSNLDKTDDAGAIEKESTKSIASNLDKTDDADAKEKESNFNIFVGANFCGKSTVMELIRRCLTDDINLSVTNSFNPTMIAYAFCEYEFKSNPVIVGFIKNPKDDEPQAAGNSMDSSTVQNKMPKNDTSQDIQKDGISKDENSQDNKPHYDKAEDGNPNGKETQRVLPHEQHAPKDARPQDKNQDDEPEEDKPYEIFKILWCRHEGGIYFRWKEQNSKREKILKDPFNEKESREEVLLSLFNKSKEEKNTSTIKRILLEIESSSSSELLASTKTPSWRSIEDAFVATFPLRGIGIVHWTKSPNIQDKSNYEKACLRAEILSKILKDDKARIDQTKEKEFFDFITHPLVFDFKMKGEEIWVTQENEKKKPFPLLKTSEGIIEAKITSLLLAHKDFQTICLEDPDRGMHPQMVERLKTILYICGFEKTIIVTTHSPYFVDTITIKKTHVFFKRKQTPGPYICSVKNAGKSDDLSYVNGIETLRSLLFATKVLLVEGSTDREVVQAIFTKEKSDKLNVACNGDISKALDDFNKMDFTTYQIISVGSCQNVPKVKRFCNFINLPCLSLVDLDFYVKLTDSIKFTSKVKENVRKKLNLDEKYRKNELSTFLEEDFKNFASEIEAENTFVWKRDLEAAILSSKELQNEIGKSLGLKFDNLNDDQKADKLKGKLKSRLSFEERTAFSPLLMKAEEIKRFIKFLKTEDGNGELRH